MKIAAPRKGAVAVVAVAVSMTLMPLGSVQAAPPSNDAFASAIELNGTQLQASGNNFEATTNDAGEPFARQDNRNKKSVWWKWTAPQNGTVAISLLGTAYDNQMLGFYVGSRAFNLKSVKYGRASTGHAQIEAAVVAGVTYHICVGSEFELGGGDIAIDLRLTPGLTGAVSPLAAGADVTEATFSLNDKFANAIVLSGEAVQAIGYMNDATSDETGEPFSSPDGGNRRTLWWKWTAPSNGTLTVSLQGTDFAYQMLGLFAGSTVRNLKTVKFEDTGGNAEQYSEFSAPVLAGVTYYVCVGYGASFGDTWMVKLDLRHETGLAGAVSPFAPGSDTTESTFALNDKFANAVELTGNDITAIGYNIDATSDELNEPFIRESPVNHRTVWWRWTAPASGTVAISLQGTDYEYNELGVYVGTRTSNLKRVAFSRSSVIEDFASITAPVVAGVTYHICVGGDPGYGGRGGAIQLKLDSGADLAGAVSPLAEAADVADGSFRLNDRFVSAVTLSGDRALAIGYHHDATIDDIREPFLELGEAGRTLWWRWTAPRSGKVTVSLGGTSFGQQMLGMYTGQEVDNLRSATRENFVIAPTGTAQISTKVAAGVTYYICVGARSYLRGNSILRLSMAGADGKPQAPFAGAGGLYQGALSTPQGMAFLSLNLTPNGNFTGSLTLNGRRIALSGRLTPGNVLELQPAGLPEISLSFGGRGTAFNASVAQSNQPSATSLKAAYRGRGEDRAPLSGRRINALALPGSGPGVGYLTGVVGANGSVRFSGLLPDGKPFTFSVRGYGGTNAAEEAKLPLSRVIGQGADAHILSGLLTLSKAGGVMAGQVEWRQAGQDAVPLTVEGNVWLPRGNTQNVLDGGSSSRAFAVEVRRADAAVSFDGSIAPGGTPSLPVEVAINLNPRNGLVRGSFTADGVKWQCRALLVGDNLEDAQGRIVYGGGCLTTQGQPAAGLRIVSPATP